MPGGPGQRLEVTFLHGVRIGDRCPVPMTRLQQLPAALQRSLEQRSALKVIAGLMNFDGASVERVARAAGRGGADLIDVACDPALVALAIEASGGCLLYTSPSPRDGLLSRMPSSA